MVAKKVSLLSIAGILTEEEANRIEESINSLRRVRFRNRLKVLPRNKRHFERIKDLKIEGY